MPEKNIDLKYWVNLSEGGGQTADRLDKQNGVIKDVLVCGLTSPNCPRVPGSKAQPTKGTRYTLEAFQEAASLYEGVKVRIANKTVHRATTQTDRHPNDTFAVLRNVYVGKDGLRAELHYDRFHSFTPSLIEDVERKFGRWGLSHVASGYGPVEDGWLVVKHIPKVRGVDLVDDPATTVSLLEDKAVTIKFIDLCESLISKVKGKKRLGLVQFMESDLLKVKLHEDDMPMGDMPMEAPPEAESDPDKALLDAFISACAPLVSSALQGDTEALKKLNEWIKAHIKLAGGGEEKPKDEAPKEEKGPPTETPESREKELERKLAKYENTAKVVALAESLGCKDKTALPVTLVETLAEVSESRWKPTITDFISRSRGPKSSGPATIPFEAKGTETPAEVKDGKSFARAVTQ